MHSLNKTAPDRTITQLAKMKSENGEPTEDQAEQLQLALYFHDMNACIQSDGNTSESFKVRSAVKQGRVLGPTLFAIYIDALQHAFGENDDGIYLRTRFNRSLFNLKRLKSKRLTAEVLIREFLLADDVVIVTYIQNELQRLVDSLVEAGKLGGGRGGGGGMGPVCWSEEEDE